MTEKVFKAAVDFKTVAFIFVAVFIMTGDCLDGLSQNSAQTTDPILLIY